MFSSAPLTDATRGLRLLSLYHYPSLVSCSRLTLMSSLRRMSCIPHLVHVSRQLFKLLHSFSPNCTTVCTITCLEEVYYTAVGCQSFFFFLIFSFCRLGGIIVISGVRICKVAISIVQYTRLGLQKAWLKVRGMAGFEI